MNILNISTSIKVERIDYLFIIMSLRIKMTAASTPVTNRATPGPAISVTDDSASSGPIDGVL